jgi:AcrR family transcriptional regulator
MSVIGRPRAFDREAALAAAMLVFWRKGSPSLYAAFGGKEALYGEAVEHYVRTIGPLVWDRLADGSTARAGVEALLLAGTETLPESPETPAGCMALLGAVGDEWPAPITEIIKTVRLEMLDKLRSRLAAAVADHELPASTDVERMSRFYLGVFQGMAIQARDGATSADLKGVVGAAMAAWPR